MNTLVVGRIYHVVDKATGEVIKVGSTIRRLDQRFNQTDYKRKYPNHFLKEFKVIQSSDVDWYDPKDPYCPFLWHLVASEHIEMVKANTFRGGPLSNQFSPLDQKSSSKFGVSHFGSIGGKIGGRIHVASGHLRSISSKGGKSGGPSNGHKNGLELARLKKGICAPGMSAKGGRAGGPASGKLAVESGRLASFRTPEHQSKAGQSANHNRWHIKRGIVNPNCKICKESNVGHEKDSLGIGS